jgi:hypothetical protein
VKIDLKSGYKKLKEYQEGLKMALEIMQIAQETGDQEILKDTREQVYEGVCFGEDYLQGLMDTSVAIKDKD